jgi:hypothetical protein
VYSIQNLAKEGSPFIIQLKKGFTLDLYEGLFIFGILIGQFDE